MSEEKTGSPQLFRITVNGLENQEWQGEVQFADGTKARFCSLLDLLNLMCNRLEMEPPAWGTAHDK